MDISQITTQMLNFSEQAAQNIQSQMDPATMQSAEGMLKIQYAFFQYTTFLTCSTSIIKSFKDLVSSIVAKI